MHDPEARRATEQLRERVCAAAKDQRPLRIVGHNSKAFYGRDTGGEDLFTTSNSGIIAYEPAELVVTARAGTTLQELHAVLAAQNQMLLCEPPMFDGKGTVGGMLAAGLSGPSRPFTGAVRDYVLGVRLMTGDGEVLRFGGQVMKNVAGYDVSRLMAGAMGTLGLILDVSLRVGPIPQTNLSLAWHCTQREALAHMIDFQSRPLPLTGLSYDGELLRLRLAGTAQAVDHAVRALGGDVSDDADYWQQLKDQELRFFRQAGSLWRLSVPPASAPAATSGAYLWDWGGACRWYRSEAPVTEIRAATAACGGHATMFRGAVIDTPFHPLDTLSFGIHQRLKMAFDPRGIFNPGRMYAGV